jgi:hypothetical protein
MINEPAPAGAPEVSAATGWSRRGQEMELAFLKNAAAHFAREQR